MSTSWISNILCSSPLLFVSLLLFRKGQSWRGNVQISLFSSLSTPNFRVAVNARWNAFHRFLSVCLAPNTLVVAHGAKHPLSPRNELCLSGLELVQSAIQSKRILLRVKKKKKEKKEAIEHYLYSGALCSTYTTIDWLSTCQINQRCNCQPLK